MGRRRWVGAGLGAVLVGAVGVGLVVAPAGASAAPVLPPVSPEDLVSSVMTADQQPFAGEVEVDNALGLPAVPGVPQLANGTSSVRVWSGGEGRGRVALPSSDGERTLVSDGTTRWSYDSRDRTATRAPAGEGPGHAEPSPTTRTRPPPPPRPSRRCDSRAPSPSTAPPRSPDAPPTSWC